MKKNSILSLSVGSCLLFALTQTVASGEARFARVPKRGRPERRAVRRAVPDCGRGQHGPLRQQQRSTFVPACQQGRKLT